MPEWRARVQILFAKLKRGAAAGRREFRGSAAVGAGAETTEQADRGVVPAAQPRRAAGLCHHTRGEIENWKCARRLRLANSRSHIFLF